MKKNTQRRGILAGAGALATAVVLALSGAAAAHAAPAHPPASSDVVITKTETPASALTGAEGARHTGQTLSGIAGSVFTLTLIEGTNAGGATSTLTNAGQIAAQGRSVAADGTVSNGALSSTTIVSGVTPANGEVTLAGVPAGQYLVTETTTLAGVTKAVPFLLTVPLTDPDDRGDWLSTIHVYPKASTFAATKSVDEGSARNVGDHIEWTVLADAPALPSAQLTSFTIADRLDARLSLVGDPALSFVTSTETLTMGAGADWTLTNTGNLVTVSFTSAGLAKLAVAGIAGDTIEVVLTTTVSATATPLSGTIPNTATVTINGETAQAQTTNTASIVFGDLVVEKQDSTDAATKLEGVKFRLFASRSAAESGSPSIGGELTTGADGRFTVPGLLRSDFVNGAITTAENDFRSFWLVETETIDGYQLAAEPIEVRVLVDGAGEPVVHVVKNAPNSDGFQLPLTGGTGTVFLTIAGIAILGSVLLFARRRRTAETTAE